MTAELAIGIPTVLGIAGIVLSALRWGMDGVTATSTAIESAYSIARGESADEVLGRAERALPKADWSFQPSGGGVCVTATVPSPLPMIQPRTVTQCATG